VEPLQCGALVADLAQSCGLPYFDGSLDQLLAYNPGLACTSPEDAVPAGTTVCGQPIGGGQPQPQPDPQPEQSPAPQDPTDGGGSAGRPGLSACNLQCFGPCRASTLAATAGAGREAARSGSAACIGVVCLLHCLQ
jgi:hypothetical protein